MTEQQQNEQQQIVQTLIAHLGEREASHAVEVAGLRAAVNQLAQENAQLRGDAEPATEQEEPA